MKDSIESEKQCIHEGTMTLEEIGKLLGITRERVRQIEAKALRKLRHPSRRRKLEDLLP